MKTQHYILLLIIIVVNSCKKDLIEKYNIAPTTQKVNATKDLVVSNEFTWQTNRNFTIEVNPIHAGVLIIQDQEGNNLYKAFLPVNLKHVAQFTTDLNTPAIKVLFNGHQEEHTLNGSLKLVSSLN